MLPGDCQSMPITICSYCVKWQLVSQIDNGSISSVAILGSEAIREASPAITIWFFPGYCLLRRYVARPVDRVLSDGGGGGWSYQPDNP